MAANGLQQVFLQRQPTLLRLLAARLGPDDAEDALQELWFKLDALAAQPGGGAPIADPAAFLFRMAANHATDRRVAAQRRTTRDDAWHDVQPDAAEQPDAERALIARDRLRAVERAIAAMPERMGAALRMFRVEERPQREIAEALGITVSGVEKLLRRAYAQISSLRDAETSLSHRPVSEGGSSRDE